MDNTKRYNYSTLILLILKDIRQTRSLTQAWVAEQLNKSQSAVNKLERGDTLLTVDTFIAFCRVFQINASNVTGTADQLLLMLDAAGFLLNTQADHLDDSLLKLMVSYYRSPGYQKIKNDRDKLVRLSELGLWPPSARQPTIIQYFTDMTFRNWMDNMDLMSAEEIEDLKKAGGLTDELIKKMYGDPPRKPALPSLPKDKPKQGDDDE